VTPDRPTAIAWQRFRRQVEERKSRKQLSFLPMVLTGFPNPIEYRGYVDLLLDYDVKLAEVVEPVTDGWAATTNEAIRAAHRVATPYSRPGDGAALAARFVGTLRVVYTGNLEGAIRSAAMSREATDGIYSILQFAMSQANVAALGLDALDVPSTTLVAAGDGARALAESARSARWMLVCKIADATGGALYDWARIEDALTTLKAASDVPLFCTFGVDGPDAIARLRSIEACDGVIVGTALLKSLSKGSKTIAPMLRDLCRAAFG
jgi:tryptophan synthase alpha chain